MGVLLMMPTALPTTMGAVPTTMGAMPATMGAMGAMPAPMGCFGSMGHAMPMPLQMPTAEQSPVRLRSRSRSPITPRRGRRDDSREGRQSKPSREEDRGPTWDSHRHQSYRDEKHEGWSLPSREEEQRGYGESKEYRSGQASWGNWGRRTWVPKSSWKRKGSGKSKTQSWRNWTWRKPVTPEPQIEEIQSDGGDEPKPAALEQAAPKSAAKGKNRDLADLFSSEEDESEDVWATAKKSAEKDHDMITPWAQLAEEDHFMPIHPMKDSVSEIYSLIKDANMGAPQLVMRRLALCLVRAGLVPEKIGEQLQWEGKGFSALSVNVETPTHIQFIDLSRTSQNYYTFCHGTSWEGAVSILGEGIIRPANFEPGSLPNSAFYGQGAVGWMSDDNIKDCVRRSYASPKGQNDALILGTATTPSQHQYIKGGGNVLMQNHTRRSGAARSEEAWTFRSNYAKIQAIAIVWPA